MLCPCMMPNYSKHRMFFIHLTLNCLNEPSTYENERLKTLISTNLWAKSYLLMQVVPLILMDVITIDFNGATHRVRRAGCGSLQNQASLTIMNGANLSFLMQYPHFSGNGPLNHKQLYTPNSVTLFM